MLKKVEKSIFLTKPIIGIVKRGVDDIYKVNKSLAGKLIKAGAIPILILSDNIDDLDEVLKLCDGIVMPGGKDIYDYDRYICKYATYNDIPLLGICIGMQIMNEKYLEKTKENHQNVMHKIITKEGTIINKLIGNTYVNSRHEECITDVDDYIISAYSEDGVIEAIEHKNNKFNVGVQWHPEDLTDDSLFIEFVKSCMKKTK